MKKRLLLIAGLFLANLIAFADNETLGVLRTDGTGNEYWEYTPGNILPSDPCTGFEFRVTFTFPSGYTGVQEFDWYANNTLIKTTTQVSYDQNNKPYGETSMLLTSESTAIICKIIYKNASNGTSSPHASPAFTLLGKPLNLQISGPTSVDAAARDVSYSITTGTSSSFVFTPPPGSYSTTWQPPSGWTQTSLTNNGNNVTFHTDDFSGGTLKATPVYNACAYTGTTSIAITRSHPMPGFVDQGVVNVCGYTNTMPITRSFSVSPMSAVTSYTWSLRPVYPTLSLDGIGFPAAGGATTITTTGTTVDISFNSTDNHYINMDVTANYADGVSSSPNTLVIDLTTMAWGTPFVWTPSCFQYQGSSVSFSAQATMIPGAYYYWYMDGFLMDEGYSNTTYLLWNGESQLSVKAMTDCGESELYTENFPTCFAAAASINMYPNPSSGQVTIDLKDLNKKTPSASQIKDIREIRIVDKLGNVKKVIQYPAGTRSASLNIGNLPCDVYTVHVTDGTNRVSRQLNKIN